MASKNDIRVTIGGKTYTLSGYESEEYILKVAICPSKCEISCCS